MQIYMFNKSIFTATKAIILSSAILFSFVSCSNDDDTPMEMEVTSENVFGSNLPTSGPGISSIKYNDKGQVTEMQTKDGTVTFSYIEAETRSASGTKIIAYLSWSKTTLEMTVGDNGYISSCIQSREADGDNPSTSETWDFKYNDAGQMNYIYRHTINEKISFDYNADGDIEHIDHSGYCSYYTYIRYTSQEYTTPIDNKYCVMDYKGCFYTDIDDMEIVYWAGLLGKATKHLPLSFYGHKETDYAESLEWSFDNNGKPINVVGTRTGNVKFYSIAQKAEYNYQIECNAVSDIRIGKSFDYSDLRKVAQSTSYKGKAGVCETIYIQVVSDANSIVRDTIRRVVKLDTNSKVIKFDFLTSQPQVEDYGSYPYYLKLSDARAMTNPDDAKYVGDVVYVENNQSEKKWSHTDVKMGVSNNAVSYALSEHVDDNYLTISAKGSVMDGIRQDMAEVKEWIPVLDVQCYPKGADFGNNPVEITVDNNDLKLFKTFRCNGALNNNKVKVNNDGTLSMQVSHSSEYTIETLVTVEKCGEEVVKRQSTIDCLFGDFTYDLPVFSGCKFEYKDNEIVKKYLEAKFGPLAVGATQVEINNRSVRAITPCIVTQVIYKYNVTFGDAQFSVDVFGPEEIYIDLYNAEPVEEVCYSWK